MRPRRTGHERPTPFAIPAFSVSVQQLHRLEQPRAQEEARVNPLRGRHGKPSHPPLTGASIGAYTVGVAMIMLGALGVEEEQMAHGGLLAIGGGLTLALPAALTGLLDWRKLEEDAPARKVATAHLITMLCTTGLFLATFIVQLSGYREDRVETAAWIFGALAEGLLMIGGYLGGAIVFVYGVRVLNRPETPPAQALGLGPVEEGRQVADKREA